MNNKELQTLLAELPDELPLKIMSSWLEEHYFEDGNILDILVNPVEGHIEILID